MVKEESRGICTKGNKVSIPAGDDSLLHWFYLLFYTFPDSGTAQYKTPYFAFIKFSNQLKLI